MSGSTERSRQNDVFLLTLATPSIEFAIDPETGESGEREFHRETAAEFDRILAAVEAPVRAGLESLFVDFAERARPIPFNPRLELVSSWDRKRFPAETPCMLEFPVPLPAAASLYLCFGDLPSVAVTEELQAAVKSLFEGISDTNR